MTYAPGRLAALHSDPRRERRLGIRFLLASIVMFLVAAAAVLALVTGEFRIRNVVWLVISIALGLACAVMAANGLMLSRRTGEDLLTVAVDHDGLVGPEQLRFPWERISRVTETVHGPSKRGVTPRSLTVHVHDRDEFTATVPQKLRWMVDKDEEGTGQVTAGSVTTGLGVVTDDEYAEFHRVLETELGSRQIPLLQKREG